LLKGKVNEHEQQNQTEDTKRLEVTAKNSAG